MHPQGSNGFCQKHVPRLLLKIKVLDEKRKSQIEGGRGEEKTIGGVRDQGTPG